MTDHEIIFLLIGLGTFLISILGLIFKVSRDFSSKIGKIYERLDTKMIDLKNEIKEKLVKYTLKDVCQVVHSNLDTNFARLEQKVDSGFYSLDAKLTELLKKGGTNEVG